MIKNYLSRTFQVLCKQKKLIQDMSLVIEDRTCFSGFCPCLYYNAVLGHARQDWLCQPCLACILLITFPIFLRRKFPAENGSVPNPDGVPSIS